MRRSDILPKDKSVPPLVLSLHPHSFIKALTFMWSVHDFAYWCHCLLSLYAQTCHFIELEQLLYGINIFQFFLSELDKLLFAELTYLKFFKNFEV